MVNRREACSAYLPETKPVRRTGNPLNHLVVDAGTDTHGKHIALMEIGVDLGRYFLQGAPSDATTESGKPIVIGGKRTSRAF